MPPFLNDTELWQLVRQNDAAAYEQLYRRYVEVIFAGIFRHVSSRADAEDITQDVFLSVWEQRHGIDLKYKFFSYLYSVARYKTYRYIREKDLVSKYEMLWEAGTADQQPGFAEPEVFWMKDILRAEQRIEQEIAALPPQMKKVYTLRIEKGLSISQIAHHLILSEHTVKKQLALLKKRLRSAALQLF
jgi:RNA polymerase sigma-70 factor (ECF subfamily)